MFLETGGFRNETLERKECWRLSVSFWDKWHRVMRCTRVFTGWSVQMDRDGELVFGLRKVRQVGWAENTVINEGNWSFTVESGKPEDLNCVPLSVQWVSGRKEETWGVTCWIHFFLSYFCFLLLQCVIASRFKSSQVLSPQSALFSVSIWKYREALP